VAPIVVNGTTVAVLDIDSPSIGRFDNEDAEGFQKIADFCSTLNWSK
jgi:GAF domain-containing protein